MIEKKDYLFLVFVFFCIFSYAQQEKAASVEGNVNNLPVREYKLL